MTGCWQVGGDGDGNTLARWLREGAVGFGKRQTEKWQRVAGIGSKGQQLAGVWVWFGMASKNRGYGDATGRNWLSQFAGLVSDACKQHTS